MDNENIKLIIKRDTVNNQDKLTFKIKTPESQKQNSSDDEQEKELQDLSEENPLLSYVDNNYSNGNYEENLINDIIDVYGRFIKDNNEKIIIDFSGSNESCYEFSKIANKYSDKIELNTDVCFNIVIFREKSKEYLKVQKEIAEFLNLNDVLEEISMFEQQNIVEDNVESKMQEMIKLYKNSHNKLEKQLQYESKISKSKDPISDKFKTLMVSETKKYFSCSQTSYKSLINDSEKELKEVLKTQIRINSILNALFEKKLSKEKYTHDELKIAIETINRLMKENKQISSLLQGLSNTINGFYKHNIMALFEDEQYFETVKKNIKNIKSIQVEVPSLPPINFYALENHQKDWGIKYDKKHCAYSIYLKKFYKYNCDRIDNYFTDLFFEEVYNKIKHICDSYSFKDLCIDLRISVLFEKESQEKNKQLNTLKGLSTELESKYSSICEEFDTKYLKQPNNLKASMLGAVIESAITTLI